MAQTLTIKRILWKKQNEGIGAEGVIPVDAEFFQDHFPGFPILPGVLALEILKSVAEQYFGEVPKKFLLKEVKAVKFARYLKPGESWKADLQLVSEEAGYSTWKGKLLSSENLAVSARLELQAI